ncbi:hypothetical protein CWC18_16330 [Pseudoalteromonas aurantia]|uniref:discoidin domain-containing protein n=1 Tax=Pseudoalteromonas aurantia TaxID=43654 RepID=UPI00110ADF21|nr:discoidin domain-containing protein [Pseudoalteromonas aurantia]TMO59249.1 hypothetical protein CWC18_16330 [Pseudoalteromonas aurantia]
MLKYLVPLALLITSSIKAHSFTLIENVALTDQKITISFNGYSDPVVFHSIPSFNDTDAGVISISNVTDSSFDAQFKEWTYLDGLHGEETVSFLIAEKGVHTLADGSIWEVGEFEIRGNSQQQFFQESFDHTPALILSGQTQNDPDAYSLRVSSNTSLAFSTTLNEQESGDNHVPETVGYLALYSSSKTGHTDSGDAYSVMQQAINQDGYQSINGKIIVNEEQSKDSETSHLLEVINILTIKNKLFGQDTTHYGKDTISLRIDTNSDFKIEPGETSGSYNNIALIGTNGLSDSSYTASNTYRADSPSGAFDGFNETNKINNDASSKIKRGIWLSTLSQEHWLQVAFERHAYIHSFRVLLYPIASNGNMGIKNVTLQVSNDNTSFVDHESFTLDKSLDQTIYLTEPAVGKYIRLKIYSTQGHSYRVIGELEYYGGFVAEQKIDPPVNNIPINGKTCESIKLENPSVSSGFYSIDPDGDDGNPEFEVYCEMTLNGGGWTLVAHHKDGLDNLEVTSPTSLNNVGVLPTNQWYDIRNSMTTGMMFMDEFSNISQISKSKLMNGNCVSINSSNDLSQPKVPFDIGVLWQHEGSGCSLSGRDYSFISLSTKLSSRGDGYLRAGASIYQHNVKFDLWPYVSNVYSGAEQNTLFYFLK